MPPLLLWMVCRFGYDRRGWLLQTLLAWVVLPATYLFTHPEDNINMVFGPGGEPPAFVTGPAYLALLMIAFPLLVYFPSHLALARLSKKLGVQRH